LIVTDTGRFRVPSHAGRAHPRPWLTAHECRAGGRQPPNRQGSNLRQFGM